MFTFFISYLLDLTFGVCISNNQIGRSWRPCHLRWRIRLGRRSGRWRRNRRSYRRRTSSPSQEAGSTSTFCRWTCQARSTRASQAYRSIRRDVALRSGGLISTSYFALLIACFSPNIFHLHSTFLFIVLCSIHFSLDTLHVWFPVVLFFVRCSCITNRWLWTGPGRRRKKR